MTVEPAHWNNRSCFAHVVTKGVELTQRWTNGQIQRVEAEKQTRTYMLGEEWATQELKQGLPQGGTVQHCRGTSLVGVKQDGSSSDAANTREFQVQ